MDPRGVPVGTLNSRALDERPLPPLPISDVGSVASEGTLPSERWNRKVSDLGIPSSSSPGIFHPPSGIAGSSTVLSDGIERSSRGPLRTSSPGSSSEISPKVVNAETCDNTAGGQRELPANVITDQSSSSATAGVEARPAVYVPKLPLVPPRVRDTDRISGTARNVLRSGNSSGSDSAGELGIRLPTASRTRSRLQSLDGAQSTEQRQVTAPKWQPDATVTICPICRTQFSFFVRKHHCRKCGRVVCGSCSPHRITIPHQYIIQPPPTKTMSPTLTPAPPPRPRLNSGRTGSSPIVENLGGGERVRLCNPCVPDPNVAPPQVPGSRNSLPPPNQQVRSRSVSSTVVYPQPGSSVHNPSMSSYYAQRSSRDPSNLNTYNTSASSHTERNTRLRPEELQNRYRSSTVGTNRDSSNMVNSASAFGPWTGTPSRPEQPQISSSRPSPAPRPVIREEDECWICHKELPTQSLPDWESVRAEHVNNCLSLAMRGPSTSPAPPAPTQAPVGILNPIQSPRITPPALAESSQNPRSTPTSALPIANTPEARMAARERAHAAVVLASTSISMSPIRRTGLFPYKATEKDCIDDAECTICLEEFEVGEDMGRLECFCRFHLRCIREWFVNRPGQCPVHQHGAGY